MLNLRGNDLNTNIKCFAFTGQIQEEKEKEAQETRQKKEKECSLSVRLGAGLTKRILTVRSPSGQLTCRVIFAFDLQPSPIQLWSSRLTEGPTDS